MMKQQGNGHELTVLGHLGCIFFSRDLVKKYKKNRIVIKATGLTNGSKNNKHFIDPPYHIDPYYTAFLHQNIELCEKLQISLRFSDQKQKQMLNTLKKTEEYQIFKYFVSKYFLIDAHKFGGLFLAYEEDYEITHANFIIFNGQYNENHMTRLAAICKKQGLFVKVSQNGQIIVSQIERSDSKKRERVSKSLQKLQGSKKLKEEQ